jgi:hypothetical protein
MPVTTIIAMADTGNHAGNGTWPTLEVASKIFDLSSFVLIGALIVGAVATILIVWMGIVKEHHWEVDRRASSERIAQLNNETAWLHEKGALTTDAVVAAAQATKANALAAQFLLALSQQLSQLMTPGMNMPGFLSLEQFNRIASKVKPFAGKQFDNDVDIASNDLERVGLAGGIGAVLEKAGWVKIASAQRSSIASVRGVIIEVDASKDSELLKAAETLSAALNAEGIAARVSPKTETDTTNVIHILVGPKP